MPPSKWYSILKSADIFSGNLVWELQPINKIREVMMLNRFIVDVSKGCINIHIDLKLVQDAVVSQKSIQWGLIRNDWPNTALVSYNS
jgi:hypothetical protein